MKKKDLPQDHEELCKHLETAEKHAQRALNRLYMGQGGVKRSFFYRWRLGRAQSILISLLAKERSR